MHKEILCLREVIVIQLKKKLATICVLFLFWQRLQNDLGGRSVSAVCPTPVQSEDVACIRLSIDLCKVFPPIGWNVPGKGLEHVLTIYTRSHISSC